MTRLGQVLAFLDRLPSELMNASDVAPADMQVVADRLVHAGTKCRALADLKPGPVSSSRRPARIGRAAAC